MTIKNLFNKQKEQTLPAKQVQQQTLKTIASEVESSDYAWEYQKSLELHLEDVDFSDPKNFVKFGTARKYYEGLVDRTTKYYPYDGSKSQQLAFENSLNSLERYELVNNYPRSTGYVNFASDGWGNISGIQSNGYGLPETTEYIYFYNQATDNVYDPTKGRRENTRFVFASGSTIEFWLKKEAFANTSTQTSKEAIFYTRTADDSKRLIVYLSGGVGASSSIYTQYLTYVPSTATERFLFNFDTGLATIADSTWHHYALSYYTSSTYYACDFYLDGKYKSTSLSIFTGFVDITGSAYGTIGSLGGPTTTGLDLTGYGKLSGSIDEFRFWNKKRDAKQIGLNYFTNVGGGTNTDLANIDLGIYFKFNEGITEETSSDSIVLDYAGRNCNGVFVGYNSGSSRSSGSAITETQERPEKGTPIIYVTHPEVQTYLSDKLIISDQYDFSNNFSIRNSMPSWVLDTDDQGGTITDTSGNGEGNGELGNLLQTLSSYLDSLYLQITTLRKIKDLSYINHSGSASNINNVLLTSNGFDLPNLFLGVDTIQFLFEQDSKRTYDESISKIKNTIYKNIYNNLPILNKSKGTENSIKSLIRTFGVNEDIFSLNIYANNVQYKFENRYVNKSVKKDYIDFTPFSSSQNPQGVIYQQVRTSVPSGEASTSFITGTSNPEIPLTAEYNFIVPESHSTPNSFSYQTLSYNTASLFGIRTANNTGTGTTIPANDPAGIKAYLVYRDNKGYFSLSCQTASIELTSSIFEDIMTNQHWNLSFQLVPFFTGSSYNLIFSGYSNHILDQFRSFSVSSSLTYDEGFGILQNNKRLYVGAERTNITGALVQPSVVRGLSARYWADSMLEEELMSHAMSPYNYGRSSPSSPYHLSLGEYFPKSESLLLHWDFSEVSASDSGGEIDVIYDVSRNVSSYNNSVLSGLTGMVYLGSGYGFAENASIKKKELVYVSERQSPENLYSSQLINILDTDDNYSLISNRPQSYFFSLEASMYDMISKNMLNLFASALELDNFVGEPMNLYKGQYSRMRHFKKIFFEKVQNVPDLDKYVAVYKWIDDALDNILANLIPVSANASEKVRTIIENHILERSKIQYYLLPGKKVTSDAKNSFTTDQDQSPPPGNDSNNKEKNQRKRVLAQETRGLYGYSSTTRPYVEGDQEVLLSPIVQGDLVGPVASYGVVIATRIGRGR